MCCDLVGFMEIRDSVSPQTSALSAFCFFVGASVETVLCSQIGIQWHVHPPAAPCPSQPSFCHHHRSVEVSQARHLTDRQMETVDLSSTTSFQSSPPPPDCCLALACKRTQRAMLKTSRSWFLDSKRVGWGGGDIKKKRKTESRISGRHKLIRDPIGAA